MNTGHAKLIIGNWKMNPSGGKDAVALYKEIKKGMPKGFPGKAVICPPALYLPLLSKEGATKKLSLGVQDIFSESEGAHTGKLSAKMLSDAGAEYAIIGHSEVRALGESDETIAKKITLAFKAGLIPVLCVGESVRDDAHEYFAYVGRQLEGALGGIPKVLVKKVVIAYEPVWAIGKLAVRQASPEESLEMALFIRKFLADMAGQKAIEGLQVLYGGSVDHKNARTFLEDGGADGLLVGRASLNAKTFIKILEQSF